MKDKIKKGDLFKNKHIRTVVVEVSDDEYLMQLVGDDKYEEWYSKKDIDKYNLKRYEETTN